MYKSLLLALLLLPAICLSQKIIELPYTNPANLSWEAEEKAFFSSQWQTEVVTNVSFPTMEVFQADPTIANGTSVIVAPGGGLIAHSIEKEGNDVARWLNSKGITAFVLKYRLLNIGDKKLNEVANSPQELIPMVKPILSLAVNDAKTAVNYVRQNAAKWDLDPGKIGLMGFSAGGSVTMGAAISEDESMLPNFIVPVYPWMTVMAGYEIPEELAPMFLVCSSDDPLLLAPESIELYSRWVDEGGKAELHMYARGGHGYGMKPQGLPSDKWIDRFYEWAVSEKIVESKLPQ